ncbi:hypothetical protein MANES_18G146801v8 [Manihot esculenta]|uniref:Uncharacterized protein n=1 Tax=Manihot esculenta TaxID=3983 RepID=A0ACB7G305_MANES|nr:hypothetical protein MANES_18G146801v8 [Manihot esculenta]
MAVQDKDFLQWPRPMKTEANQRDPDKYCQYHRTHGHDTNNCFQLITEIERPIKRGHLRNFVKKPEGQRPLPNSAVQVSRRTGAGPVNDGSSGTINMIVGGTGGRMSRRGKKRSREGESSSAEIMQVIEHSPGAITFSLKDAQGVQMPHDDALVIEAVIHNYRVKKILVDDGSKVNLLPYRVFQHMGIPEEQLVRDQAPIKGIGGVPVPVEGKVKLALTLGEAPKNRTHYAVFLVVKLPLSYNAILGRPALFDFEAVTSIRYLAMKFPTEAGVGVVRGSQEEARAVYLATVAELSSAGEKLDSEVLEVRDEEKEAKTEPVGELETFPLSEAETDKVLSLNAGLTKEQKTEVMALIRGHASSFAWKPSDMPGIDPEVMTHKLNVFPEARPIKQRRRIVGREKQQTMREEILLSNYELRRVLVDTGSSVNFLILNIFNKLGLDKNSLVKVSYPLVELGDKIVAVLGTINLPLVLGDETYRQELYVEFAVVDILFAYNVILGHPVLNCHGIIINMGAMCLKLPALGRIVVV